MKHWAAGLVVSLGTVGCSGEMGSISGNMFGADSEFSEKNNSDSNTLSSESVEIGPDGKSKSVARNRGSLAKNERGQPLAGPDGNDEDLGTVLNQAGSESSSSPQNLDMGGGLGPAIEGGPDGGTQGGSPVNVAGAYLVQPQMAGCANEIKGNYVFSICGVSFQASAYVFPTTVNGKPSLDGITVAPLNFKVPAGNVITAETKEKAMAMAKEFFVSTDVTLGATKLQAASLSNFTLKNAAGEVVVFSRTDAGAQATEISSVKVSHESASIAWQASSSTLTVPNGLNPDDVTYLNLLTGKGFTIAQKLMPGQPSDTPNIPLPPPFIQDPGTPAGGLATSMSTDAVVAAPLKDLLSAESTVQPQALFRSGANFEVLSSVQSIQ